MSDIIHIKKMVREMGIQLGEPLAESAIAAFEHQHHVALPSDFRTFLLEVGNGGGGPPEYGLLPLGEIGSDFPPGFEVGYGARLAKPFPLVKYWLWDDDEPDEETETRIAQLADGGLLLGSDGCGQYWVLVVSGPSAGEIWQLAEDGAQPCAPKRTFTSWYASWLNGDTDWWAAFQS